MNLRFSLYVLFGLIMVACSPPPKVAVDERATISRAVEIEEIGGALIRYVQPGDTLHAIAFVASLDVNDIAVWNGIRETTQLQIGQRIRLTKPIGFEAPTAAVPQTVVVTTPALDAPSQSGASSRLPQTSTPRAVDIEPPKPVSSSLSDPVWNWPLRIGEVLRHFSLAAGQQGIDIGANIGDPVTATNAGEVVYVGNSLKGYGNLVIIKHDQIYLSAYAHNREIYVREGERVSAQQRIASVGINGHKEAALHFQIRENGQPVNPLLFLSKAS